MKMKDFRYEKKFLIKNSSSHEVNSIIKKNPYLFRKKFEQRFVNNIYFDDLNYSLYKDHVIGKSDRYKIRVRWYNKLIYEVKKPVLEIKCKKNQLGKKEFYNLNEIVLNKSIKQKELNQLIKNNNIPDKIKVLNIKPVLINRYLRNYFESADKRFRITLDTDLSYFSVSNNEKVFNKIYEDKHVLVLELKYGFDDENYVNNITSHIPFRATKSSKYVRGIEMIKDVII